jgi:predicted nucleic acid-binding protein
MSQHYAQAVDILSSFEYTIRVNDAIHVALALLEGYHLYTSDEDMHECALAQGVTSTYVP